MTKLLSSVRAALLAAVAALAVAAAPAPAKAQVNTEADNVVIQLGGALGQAAGAVANAQSNAAVADINQAAVNLVNTSDIMNEVSVSSAHLGVYGSVNTGVANVVGQVGLVGSQSAGAVGNALAAGNAIVKQTTANIVNASTVGTKVSVSTTRH